MNLPNELQQAIKMPWTAQLPDWVSRRGDTVKKVLPLETDSQKSGQGTCTNCGDVGYIFAFLMIGGPYKSPSSGMPMKWIDGSWYSGFLSAYPCPDCSSESMDHVLEHEPAMDGKGATKDWTI